MVLANDFIIDDRMSGNLKSNLGFEWSLVTDQVMGGASSGKLVQDTYRGKDCLRMQAVVSTENNGGFVQIALSLSDESNFDASSFAGIVMEVAGNTKATIYISALQVFGFHGNPIVPASKPPVIGKLSAFLFLIWMPTNHQITSVRIN